VSHITVTMVASRAAAVHLLRTTQASVDESAARVGYADGVTLRSLLRLRLRLGIKEIKRSA
jgi:transcriptional regulator GlxA family with amidase domain